MNWEITLKRRQTLSPVQNARQLRVTVSAPDENTAKAIALFKDNNGKYFVVSHVRKS